MLWYSIVANWNNGSWEFWQYVGLAFAILIDIGAVGKSTKDRKPYGCL